MDCGHTLDSNMLLSVEHQSIGIGVGIHLNRLADTVYNHRTARCLSIRQASTEMGISPSTLSRIEREALPDLITYIKLCRWVNRPFNHFFTVHQ